MAPAPASYVHNRPEDTVRYGVVEEHMEAFFRHLGKQGASLPAFVYAEFERYLRSGRLEHGFVRMRCTGYHLEHLVASRCKSRGYAEFRNMLSIGVLS